LVQVEISKQTRGPAQWKEPERDRSYAVAIGDKNGEIKLSAVVKIVNMPSLEG